MDTAITISIQVFLFLRAGGQQRELPLSLHSTSTYRTCHRSEGSNWSIGDQVHHGCNIVHLWQTGDICQSHRNTCPSLSTITSLHNVPMQWKSSYFIRNILRQKLAWHFERFQWFTGLAAVGSKIWMKESRSEARRTRTDDVLSLLQWIRTDKYDKVKKLTLTKRMQKGDTLTFSVEDVI